MLMSESKLIHLFSSNITQCCSLWVEEAIGVIGLKSMDQEVMCGKRTKSSHHDGSLFSAWFLFITELLSFTSFSGPQKTYPHSSKRSNVVSILCIFPHTQALNSSCFKFIFYF